MNSRLTVILPLRGRPLFTLRFLWHANAAQLPYKFIIADGEVKLSLARILEKSRAIFPNLDIDYIRYPDDTNFAGFFAKLTDALQRVQTPYAMIAANDDFLMFAGLERSLDFLDAHADYVCCGGGIGGFGVDMLKYPMLEGLRGPFSRLAYRYASYDRSFDLSSSSAFERLIVGLRNTWSYYGAFRTLELTTIWREATEINMSDLLLHEKFSAMRTLTLGKAKSDHKTFSYMRQYWTSQGFASPNDWVHHLIRSHFNTDFDEILSRISRLTAAADGGNPETIADNLRKDLAQWFGNYLQKIYGPTAALRRDIRDRIPQVLDLAKKQRSLFVPLQRHRLFATLRKKGASDTYLTPFRRELGQIEETLCGSAFDEFVQPYVSIFASA
jgi:glycosyltransferase domain-containing protein